MERGEIAIVIAQFAALIAVVLLLSSFTPGQSSQSSPVIGTVYWGSPAQGVALQNGGIAKVTQNQSVITADFTVAFSTKPSAVTGSRLCIGPNSTLGESTTYTYIPFTYDSTKTTYSVALSPTVQQPGWVCTYTIKVTDTLSQSATWLGSVQFNP